MAVLGGSRVAGTTPYAWPYDGDLGAEGTAVLVIAPAAPWPFEMDDAALSRAAEVASAVESAGGAVISLLTAPPPAHDAGPAPVGLPRGSITIESAGVDGFYGSSLEPTLRGAGISRLVLVGLGAETSIHSTMRTANDMGYECLYVADACVPYDASLAPHAVSSIEMSGGIFGAVGTAAAVVAAMTGRNQ
jgi:hypothetical protein